MARHKAENPYIYGLHDPGGEHLMMTGGEAKGWVLVTEAIGTEAHEQGGKDYRNISDKGLGVIVRLNQSYGPNGTIPREKRYPEFAQRCANFARNSQGAHIWLIGNEMNFEREQPRKEGSDQAEPITPRRYATCYKMVRDKIKSVPGHEDDIVVVGAIGPWNAQTPYDADPEGKYPANKIPGAPGDYPYFGFFGDYIRYWHDILAAIGPENCDALAIHAYSHGYRPEMVFDESKMGPPFDKYFYNFFTYKDLMNAVPENMRHLPVYLTEMNGDREGHNGPTWPFGNNGWIKNAYKEINNWNKSGKQQIRCAILFRWMIDPLGWSIDGKPEVQQDFKEAIAQNYKWNPDASQPKPAAAAPPDKPGYRAKYLGHNTPGQLSASQTLTVNLSLQNDGGFEWAAGGDKPFRLGFQWYNAAGQFISLPANLDFRASLPKNVPPGGQVQLQARLRTPDAPGSYQLRWDMVHEQVTWFSSQGDTGLVLPVSVAAGVTPAVAPAAGVAPAAPVKIQAQDVSAGLPQHATKRYPMRTHADIKRIIIHHTATPANISVERIAAFQVKNRDMPGIAYHYCITAEGDVFQTQYLETVANHAGNNSADSVGVCLIGNFTSAPPPQSQQDAAAALLAQLATHLGLSAADVFGYNELVTTGSPGATWPTWKPSLINKMRNLMAGGQPIAPPKAQPKPQPEAAPPAQAQPAAKAIEHYMLFWHKSAADWAEWDLQGALPYIAKYKPAVGFDVAQAQQAKYVTIVGGVGGVPAKVEAALRDAGCQVERIDGGSEAGTRDELADLVKKGQRFKTLK
ncbi:MAG: hypothetical protein Kow0031_36290 [Anaerolineae bacterium]